MTITPTVGRVVWYYQNAAQLQAGEQPYDAHVCKVWSDRLINVGGFDPNGFPFQATSVPLLQEGDTPPAAGAFCMWMPFQISKSKESAAS